jgi:tetratricopeptide (TPR) repeat protein
MFRPLIPALLLIAALSLSACDSAEERAEKHYQTGLELLEAGDVDRALVEFRNVFQLNSQHHDARLTYARVQRERGEVTDAYSQYLRVAEQYPEDAEARLALTEMAIEANDWAEAERHGREVQKLLPDDPLVQMIAAALDYRAARLAKTSPAQPLAAAEALARAHPDDRKLMLLAHKIRIDFLVTGPSPQEALPELEAGLALAPDQLEWQMLKLRLLTTAGDTAAVGRQLAAMYEIFPDDSRIRALLISWYMQEGDLDGAEAFLRRLAADAAASGEAVSPAALAVVQFLQQTRGPEAAMAEVERLIATDPSNAAFQATRAGLDFEAGNREAAVAALETLLKDAPETDEIRNIKVIQARMLQATGNNVGARARIEEVLASDPGHVGALKMKAAWLIQEDRPGDAVVALRTALDQAPRDAEVLTLMGQAHERDGARDLAGERYALAVEVSGRAPEETLRYAQFLIADDRLDAARTLVDDALRGNPRDLSLRKAQVDILIRMRNWDTAAQSVASLRGLGTPAAQDAANRFEALLLLRQEKTDETIAFLQDLVAKGDAGTAAVASLVQAQVQAGQTDAARDYLDEQLRADPADPTLRFLRAGLHLLAGESAEAEAIYRSLIAEDPASLRPVQTLYKHLLTGERADEARAVLDAALAADPDSVPLQLMRAGELERAQDFDGAIALFEALYAKNSNSLVLANNLASMITTYRDDPEGLERAAVIARRLRGSDVPAFQDTYGWIEYRRGNFEEALAHLEPAAQGLPRDAMVQMHLGLTYAALNRPDDARRVLTQALEMAGDTPLPQFEAARTALAALPAAGSGEEPVEAPEDAPANP